MTWHLDIAVGSGGCKKIRYRRSLYFLICRPTLCSSHRWIFVYTLYIMTSFVSDQTVKIDLSSAHHFSTAVVVNSFAPYMEIFSYSLIMSQQNSGEIVVSLSIRYYRILYIQIYRPGYSDIISFGLGVIKHKILEGGRKPERGKPPGIW